MQAKVSQRSRPIRKANNIFATHKKTFVSLIRRGETFGGLRPVMLNKLAWIYSLNVRGNLTENRLC